MDPAGFEPAAPALQRRCSTRLSYGPWVLILHSCLGTIVEILGGDPAAGSPTATLLRLNPPHEPQVRPPQNGKASPRARSGGLTGGVCKEQGRIHRAIMTHDY